jgi:hypothetical protein
MMEAIRSMPEWADSEIIPSEPVTMPVMSLSSVMMAAAQTEKNAAERLAPPVVIVCCSCSAVWFMHPCYRVLLDFGFAHTPPPPLYSYHAEKATAYLGEMTE